MLFVRSPGFEAEAGGFLSLTQQVPEVSLAFRAADAASLAALELNATGRRRALVVLLGAEREDEGLYSPAQARAFAALLQVPVFVWSTEGKEPHPEWGEVRFVGIEEPEHPDEGFAEAVRALRRSLESQRVVWLLGRHRPQTIELTASASGVRWPR